MLKIEANPNTDYKKIMFDMWHKMGVEEKTCQMFYEHALDEKMYIRNIKMMKEHFYFEGAKVLDIGSGWGGLTKLLAEEGAEMYAIEPIYEHAQVTANRCPSAHVFQEDACNLPFIDESFDIVISHSIIEHIDTQGRRGLSLKNDKKQAHVKEMARVLKTGGQGMITTGNFSFPFDGEVSKWLFHWLPDETQKRWLSTAGESSDTYTLLMWSTLKKMILQSGLTIDEVRNPDSEVWRPQLEKLDGFTRELCDMIIDLIKNNPNFMNSWFVFFTKKEILISGDEC